MGLETLESLGCDRNGGSRVGAHWLQRPLWSSDREAPPAFDEIKQTLIESIPDKAELFGVCSHETSQDAFADLVDVASNPGTLCSAGKFPIFLYIDHLNWYSRCLWHFLSQIRSSGASRRARIPSLCRQRSGRSCSHSRNYWCSCKGVSFLLWWRCSLVESIIVLLSGRTMGSFCWMRSKRSKNRRSILVWRVWLN